MPLYLGMPIIDRPLRGQTGRRRSATITSSATSFPDFRWTYTNNVSYKRLTLYGLLDGTLGQEIYNQGEGWGLLDFSSTHFDQGRQDGRDGEAGGLRVARRRFGEHGHRRLLRPARPEQLRRGRRLVHQAARGEPQLSHRLGRGKVGDWSVGLVGRNLYTWTKYSRLDPEVGATTGGNGTTSCASSTQTDAFGFPNAPHASRSSSPRASRSCSIHDAKLIRWSRVGRAGRARRVRQAARRRQPELRRAERVLGTPADIEAFLGSYYKRWHTGMYGSQSNLEGMAAVMSFETYSTLSNNCIGQRVGIPRAGNDNSIGNLCAPEQQRVYDIENEVERVASSFLRQRRLDGLHARHAGARPARQGVRPVPARPRARLRSPRRTIRRRSSRRRRDPLDPGKLAGYKEVSNAALAAFDTAIEYATACAAVGTAHRLPDGSDLDSVVDDVHRRRSS